MLVKVENILALSPLPLIVGNIDSQVTESATWTLEDLEERLMFASYAIKN